MADPIGINSGVLEEGRNVFSNRWFTYLEQLGTANLQGDFSEITPLDPGATDAEVIAKVNEILAVLQG